MRLVNVSIVLRDLDVNALRLPNWQSYNRLQFLRCNASRIAQINLVMTTFVAQIELIAQTFGVIPHNGDRLGLGVVGSDVHALHAESFLDGQKLRPGEIGFLLTRRFFDRPTKDVFRYKIG